MLRQNDAEHRAAVSQPAGHPRRCRHGRGCAGDALLPAQDPVYRTGVYGAAIWYVLGLLYFAFVGRHQLVLSPEEEFALTKGEHGHPEREGYGTTKI